MNVNIKTSNTIIYCRKWEETVNFYKNKLGFRITASRNWFVEFRLNDASRLSVADEAGASVKSSCGRGLTFTFQVDDIEKTYLLLSEAGINPTPLKNHSWGARVFYIYDPEGNRIEFWSEAVEK